MVTNFIDLSKKKQVQWGLGMGKSFRKSKVLYAIGNLKEIKFDTSF